MKRCFLCGRNGSGDRLERHHIYGAAYRDKSEKYGLVVYLCGERCHRNGEKSAHRCRETADLLKRKAQIYAMKKYGLTKEEFIKEFGKSYI